MRRIAKSEFNTGWAYWLSTSFFGAFTCLCGCVLITGNQADKPTAAVCGLIFLTFTSCGILWPVLRMREAQKVEVEHIRTMDEHYMAVFFPASRVKILLCLIGSLLFVVGSALLSIFADTLEYRIKGIIATIGWSVAFGFIIKSRWEAPKGILLTPHGIIWRELFRADCVIPWEEISLVGLFLKKEKNVPKPALAFGLKITNPANVKTSTRTRATLQNSAHQHGWHLHFLAETIAVPLRLVEMVIEYYLVNPQARLELGTYAGIERVQQMADQPEFS